MDDTDISPLPIGGWIPPEAPPFAAFVDAALIGADGARTGPTGSAAVPAAVGGLATWLPDGRWSSPAELDAAGADPPRRARRRGGPGSTAPPGPRPGEPERLAGQPGSFAGEPGRSSRASDNRIPAWQPIDDHIARLPAGFHPAAGHPPGGRAAPGQSPGDRTAATRSQQDDSAVVRRRRRLAVVRALARLAGWPRRVLAGALALAGVLLLLRPDPPPTPATTAAGVPVVVVARDLAAGSTLASADLHLLALPPAAVPSGAAREVRAVLGRVIAGPVRRGEALTDARLLGPGLTAGLDPRESTAVPVRLADPETVALVRPGDRVDVLGTPVQPDADGGGASGGAHAEGDAVTIASGVRVLAVLRGKDAVDGALLVVATEPSVGRRLTGAAAGHRLTVAVRPP